MIDSKRMIARQHLDQRLSAFRPRNRLTAPPKGWIRAIRDALGMTSNQLGIRLGMRPQSVGDLENSEVRGTIQLKTLRKVADALDCTLVYALVPNSSLENTVKTRAREIASRESARAGHSMDLEAQGLSQAERDARVDDYARDHIKARDLWEQS